MKRQGAFVGNKRLLKGGLHCHTTRSDGAGSPAEVIRLHKSKGYDFLALTDHRIYNYKNFSPETEITIIPAMEIDNTFIDEMGFRTFHTVCLGPDDETNGCMQDEKYMPRGLKSQEEFQSFLDEIHAKNNITIYCHPEWSGTPARWFDKLKGNFAFEICNTSSESCNDMDHDNGFMWDELLGKGVKLYGVADDDGHSMSEHGLGWVMVNSENNVKSILEALKNGDFYSTKGPEFKDFYVNDEGVAHVDVTNCTMVGLSSDKHPTQVARSSDGKLTSAEFNVGEGYSYVRAYAVDEKGNKAWTNPIFLSEE